MVSSLAMTGASGFIGRHLWDGANRAGVRVVALPREALGQPGLERHLGGVGAVVHLAGRLPGRDDGIADTEAAFRADNVTLTLGIADACVRAGVARFVFVSSAGVLGRQSPPGGFDDSSVPAPHDAYTRSKLAAEDLLLEHYSDRLEIVIVRPPLVYGPGTTGRFHQIVRLALSGWPLPLGAIDAPRSMVSVRNLSDLLLSAARVPDVRGLRLLAADAEMVGVANLLRAIAAAAGRRARIVRVPPVLLGVTMGLIGRGDEFRSLASPFVVRCSLAREQLGWTPPFRQMDEIAWTVAALTGAGC